MGNDDPRVIAGQVRLEMERFRDLKDEQRGSSTKAARRVLIAGFTHF